MKIQKLREFKHALIGSYASLLKRVHRTPQRRSNGHVAIILPAAPGSMGDEAMLEALCDELANIGIKSATILSVSPLSLCGVTSKF